MNWNYDYAFAEMFILSIIAVYFFARSKVVIRKNRLFLMLLIDEVLVLVTDMIGSYSIAHFATTNPGFTIGVNSLYFLFFFTRNLAYLLFSIEVMQMIRVNKYLQILNSLFYWGIQATVILNPVFGWIFTLDDGIYKIGPLYGLVYLQFFVYFMAVMAVLSLKKREEVFGAYRGIIVFWLILLVGNVIRFLVPTYLILNMFSMMAIMVIFMSFTNPIAYMDRKTNLYNEYGLTTYIGEKLQRSEFYLVACVIKNKSYMKEIYTNSDMSSIMGQIAKSLRTFVPESIGFYTNTGYFVFVSEKPIDVENFRDMVERLFSRPWRPSNETIYLKPGVFCLASDLGFASVDDFMQNMQMASDSVYGIDAPSFISRGEIGRQFKVREILAYALANNSVQMYLQPIVDSRTGKIVGAEALARLQDDALGTIYPNEFISYAEQNGSIAQLGRQMFEKSCQFMSEYQEKLGLWWINVNLSPIQCMNRNLDQEFKQIIEKYKISPSYIHLEITEETMIDANLMLEQMERLRGVGFRFALDDYGSGYANITRLTEFPLGVVKLDRSLLTGYFKKPTEVLRGTIETLSKIGYQLVAEGVETEEMVPVLREMGVDFLQGYYYSKPIPVEEFLKLDYFNN